MPCHFYSQTNVLHSSNKVFSPKIRKLKAQHHKEENQSRTGFGAAIKQLAANPRCTFKCKSQESKKTSWKATEGFLHTARQKASPGCYGICVYIYILLVIIYAQSWKQSKFLLAISSRSGDRAA